MFKNLYNYEEMNFIQLPNSLRQIDQGPHRILFLAHPAYLADRSGLVASYLGWLVPR